MFGLKLSAINVCILTGIQSHDPLCPPCPLCAHLDALLLVGVARADHAHAGLPLQVASLVVVGDARGHAHAAGGGALAPLRGLDEAVVPRTLWLGPLGRHLSEDWKSHTVMGLLTRLSGRV